MEGVINMAKRNQAKPIESNDSIDTKLSEHLLKALTQQEIAQLIDALFGVLSSELQEQAIDQLLSSTQQTVRQILAPVILQDLHTTATPIASLSKQAQTWSKLWGEWNTILSEVSEEDGKYIVQEVSWEEPYFDNYTFMEDLENIATQLLPLISIAIENNFDPKGKFIEELTDVEVAVVDSIPDWMGSVEDLDVQHNLTHCVLQWEYLWAQAEEQDAFYFAQSIRQHETQFQLVCFDCDALTGFLSELPTADQQNILAGLIANQTEEIWQHKLMNTNSHWHDIYLYWVEKYEPDRYLEKLQETIPQKWHNGLPLIEELLSAQKYSESLVVIEDVLQSFYNHHHIKSFWNPELDLLVAITNFYYGSEIGNIKMLLGYYQQTLQGLKKPKLANALIVQQVAINQWLDWSVMFTTFAETTLSKTAHKSLFASWRDYVDKQCRPCHLGLDHEKKGWWVPWLMDSVADVKKGEGWFKQELTHWIFSLPGAPNLLGNNYHILRMLTQDLVTIQQNGQFPYPHFYEVVIFSREHSPEKHQSRREYLKLYALDDLLEQVMNYWKMYLHLFVPKPEFAEKSDYTSHAKWMMALRELSPQDYKTILSQWKLLHHRRINLWKAMNQMGLS
jgi:hypothetical protein